MSYVLEGGRFLHNSQARCYTVDNKHEAISSFGSLSLFTALPFMAGTVIIGMLAKAAETHRYAEEVTFNNKFIKLFTLLQSSSEAETPRHCFKSGSFQLCNRTPWRSSRPAVSAWEREAFSGLCWKFQVYEAFMSEISLLPMGSGFNFFL